MSESDDELTMDELADRFNQLVDHMNTLTGAIICIMVTLRNEGIELSRPDDYTLN